MKSELGGRSGVKRPDSVHLKQGFQTMTKPTSTPRAALIVIGAVVLFGCSEAVMSPSDSQPVAEVAFARRPNSGPGTPDKNKSCDTEPSPKGRKSPNEKNECEDGGGGNTSQAWRIMVANMIDGDTVFVCGPRAAGASITCSTGDTDHLGIVTIASDPWFGFDDPTLVLYYYNTLSVAVTAEKPYITAYPVRAGRLPGVGPSGLIAPFQNDGAFGLNTLGTACERNSSEVLGELWFERCLSTTSAGAVRYELTPGRSADGGGGPSPTFDGNWQAYVAGNVSPALGSEGTPTAAVVDLGDLYPGTLSSAPWFRDSHLPGLAECTLPGGQLVLFNEGTLPLTGDPAKQRLCGVVLDNISNNGSSSLTANGDYIVLDAYVRVPADATEVNFEFGTDGPGNEIHLMAGKPGALSDLGGGFTSSTYRSATLALSALSLTGLCDGSKVLQVRLYHHDGSNNSGIAIRWRFNGTGTYVAIPAASVSTPAGYQGC